MSSKHLTGEKVTVSRKPRMIPTYKPNPPMDLPMFFEKKPYQGATGRLYPIPFADSLSEEKKEEAYDAVELDNEYLKVIVLPQLGGKIFRALDKTGNYDFMYYNSVIKPAMIGLGGPWVSGGIEFNWPQHHRPTTFMPVDACVEEGENGEKTVWVGEVEPFNRNKGMAGITICPGRSYVKAKVSLYNRTPYRQPFMWWANLAVPVNESYRITFPPDVEYVNDHDRRAVISWPVAKGVYETARPYDFGEGTDLTGFNAIQVNSSYLVSEGQSDMDFVSGYDHGKQMGIVAFVDHSIGPGKKLFHWGVGDFGKMWCSNLTDDDGPYVELMTGVYTDNQPDFTWIMPYETKTFEQYWYPIHNIGDVKNATIDAAVNMEVTGGELFVGIQATGTFDCCSIRIFHKGEEVWKETADMDPSKAFIRRIPMEPEWSLADLSIECTDENGHMLISYKPPVRGIRKPVEARKPAKRPCEIENSEELFINGFHLEQYKHMTFDAKDYYLEGLRRDPGDIRCNTAMGRLELANSRFEQAIAYFDKALERLMSRNTHPADVEAIYLRGMALKHLKRFEEARKMFNKAVWSYGYRSAAYYELALLETREGCYEKALQNLQASLDTNPGSLKALNLKSAILRAQGKPKEAYELSSATSRTDRLDLWSYIERTFAAAQMGSAEQPVKEEIKSTFRQAPEDYLDVVCEYMHAGLYTEAVSVLQQAGQDYALVKYYLAYIANLLDSGEALAHLVDAEALTGICFPSRLEDVTVLTYAIQSGQPCANASYMLGCLYYDRFRYDDAVACWEKAIAQNPRFANAYRNLSLAYFDKRHDARGARICLENALQLKPDDARLLYELQQLLKNNGVAPEKRLELYRKHEALMLKRDDCYLDYIMLHCIQGDSQKAIDMALKRTFHIYEGGEGKITRLHAWMHVLRGNELADKEPEQAEKTYRDGLIIPRSYGEAKSTFAQESHIYYFLGELLEKAGRVQEARDAYCEAAVYKAAVSDLSMFRALAMQRLGQFSQAQTVLNEMLEAAEDKLVNKDRYAYFGVGSPTPMPFEYDIERINLVEGYVLKAFALLGLGRTLEAREHIEKARALNPNEFEIYAFDRVAALLA